MCPAHWVLGACATSILFTRRYMCTPAGHACVLPLSENLESSANPKLAMARRGGHGGRWSKDDDDDDEWGRGSSGHGGRGWSSEEWRQWQDGQSELSDRRGSWQDAGEASGPR